MTHIFGAINGMFFPRIDTIFSPLDFRPGFGLTDYSTDMEWVMRGTPILAADTNFMAIRYFFLILTVISYHQPISPRFALFRA